VKSRIILGATRYSGSTAKHFHEMCPDIALNCSADAIGKTVVSV